MKKKITRSCVVCGKKIKTNIDDKGKYDNGHYFGNVKVPIDGTGEFKTIGKRKIGDIECEIAGWTGKEKSFEYWECNECFQEALLEDEKG